MILMTQIIGKTDSQWSKDNLNYIWKMKTEVIENSLNYGVEFSLGLQSMCKTSTK